MRIYYDSWAIYINAFCIHFFLRLFFILPFVYSCVVSLVNKTNRNCPESPLISLRR